LESEVSSVEAAKPRHVPVLLDATLHHLGPVLEQGGCWVDCTVGLGGHAAAMLESFPAAQLVAIDRDAEALQWARERLSPFGTRVRFLRASFSELTACWERLDAPPPRAVFADLGVSSLQIDTAGRGFSFQQDGPLDMRMGGAVAADRDVSQNGDAESPTAELVVNRYPEEALANIFKDYGEEAHARRIARGIVAARQEEPIVTTGQLARLVAKLKPGGSRPRHGRRPLHPATQVFQALRIEVNRELDELHSLIDQAVRLLDQEGRLAIISYHSLEDRIVKHTLRDLATGEIEPITGRPRAETQVIEVLTRKPVRPDEQEIAANPRARSARMRVARRL
jgi:16S rRNA (cytosine1402-N4)-methyltransferase